MRDGNRQPEHVADLLDGVLRRLGVARPVEVTQLVAEWPRLAGEPWASRATPAGLTDGVLVVDAADSTAASLLKYQKKALLGRLEELVGKGLVTDVIIRVARRGTGRPGPS